VKDYKEKVTIYTDSNYSILCCTSYGEKCKRNNWRNPNNKSKPIPNLELLKEATDLMSICRHVSFQYIRAHTGFQDIHSTGNQQADKLANDSLKDAN
jgi:ribonuclease HI